MQNKFITVVVAIIFVNSACSKKEDKNLTNKEGYVAEVAIDTATVDSFGPGATSQAVMDKINAVAIKRERDSLAAIAATEQEKINKEMATEVEKRQQEAEKKSKETKPETPKTAENLPANP